MDVFRWNQVGLALPSRSYLAPASAKLLARWAAQGTGKMHFSTDWRSRRKLKRERGTARMVLKYVRRTPGALAMGGPYHEASFQVSELSRGVVIAGVKWYPGSYGETDDYAFKVLNMYVVTVVDTRADLDGDIGVFAVEKHDFCGVSRVPGVRTVRTVSVGRRFVLCNSIRHLVTLYRDARNPSLGTTVRVKDTTELAAPDVYVD